MTIASDIDTHCDLIKDNYLKYKDQDQYISNSIEFINKIKTIKTITVGDDITIKFFQQNTDTNEYSVNFSYSEKYQYFDLLPENVLFENYNQLKEVSKIIKDLIDTYNLNGSSFTYAKPDNDNDLQPEEQPLDQQFHNIAEKIYTTTTTEKTKANYYYRSFRVFLEAMSSIVNTVLFYLNKQIFTEILKRVKATATTINNSLNPDNDNTILDDLKKLSENYLSKDENVNIVVKIINSDDNKKEQLTQFNNDVIKLLGENVHSFLNYLHNTSNTLKKQYKASTSNYKNEYEETRKNLGEINKDIEDNIGDIKSLKEISKQIEINEKYYTGFLYTVIAIVIVCSVMIMMSINNSYDTQVALLYSMIGVLVFFYLFYIVSMRFMVTDIYEGFSDSGSTYIDTMIKEYMKDTLISLETSSSNSFYLNTVMPAMQNEKRKYDTLKVKSLSHKNKHKLFNNESLHRTNTNRFLIDLIVGMVISTIIAYIIFLTFPENTFMVVATSVVLYGIFLSIYMYQTQKRSNSSFRHMYFT